MSTDIQFTELVRADGLAVVWRIVFIITAAALLIFLCRQLFSWIASKLHGRPHHYVLASEPIIRLFIILVTLASIVPLLIQPSFENLMAVMGAVGLALGFALRDYGSSLIAGFVAVGEMPYRSGDWVDIDGIYGEVKHVGLRCVSLITPEDSVVTIPHLKLWKESISNANNGGSSLQCIAHFYLEATHDCRQVIKVLEDIALTSAYIQLNQPVVVLVEEKPWGSHYRLKAYPVAARQQFLFVTDLTVRAKTHLLDIGVTFAQSSVVAKNE